MRQNIQLIVSDFERAQITSARNKFLNARISGCLFHYEQVKKIAKINLNTLYNKFLSLLKIVNKVRS